MSQEGYETANYTHPVESLNRPAVGLIVTADNTDAVVRVIYRAAREGYTTIVTHYGDSTLPAMQFAQDLNAHVVHPDSPHPTTSQLRQVLAHTARKHGFPGLLVHEVAHEPIDYETSLEKLRSSDGYVVDAETVAFEAWSRTCQTLVAIPAYNEESTIGDIVTRTCPYADCVLVVDDGSSDETAIRAKEAGAFVITHERNQGYGGALKTAFMEARKRNAHHLVTIDGDGQHLPEDIPKLVERLDAGGADFVIGSRFADGAELSVPLYRRFGLWVVNFLTNLSLGLFRADTRVMDTQSGFRAYDERVINALVENRAITDHMSASTDILYHAHKNKFVIDEVGVSIDYDVENGSSHHPLKHGYVLVRNLLNTVERDHPISVLGVPGFLFSLVGISFGYLTVVDYLASQSFAYGMALTSSFFILSGVLACFTAIILHSFNMHLSDHESN